MNDQFQSDEALGRAERELEEALGGLFPSGGAGRGPSGNASASMMSAVFESGRRTGARGARGWRVIACAALLVQGTTLALWAGSVRGVASPLPGNGPGANASLAAGDVGRGGGVGANEAAVETAQDVARARGVVLAERPGVLVFAAAALRGGVVVAERRVPEYLAKRDAALRDGVDSALGSMDRPSRARSDAVIGPWPTGEIGSELDDLAPRRERPSPRGWMQRFFGEGGL
jgi:hypothetical protein